MKKIPKILFAPIILLVILLLFFLPFIPNKESYKIRNASISDIETLLAPDMGYRSSMNIEAEYDQHNLTPDDIVAIIKLIKGPWLISLYGYYFKYTDQPIRNISFSKPIIRSKQTSYNTWKKWTIPTGTITIRTGYVFDTLSGFGYFYYLDKINGKWIIIGRGSWVS